LSEVKLRLRCFRTDGADIGDGKACIRPQDSLGTSPVLEQEKGRERQKKEAFKRKLLRKRATYIAYFNRGLPAIDAALRRVQTYRSTGVEVVNPIPKESSVRGVQSNERVAKRVVREKVPLRECGRKEKEELKKYALRVIARVDRKVSRVNKGFERALMAKPVPEVPQSLINIGGRLVPYIGPDLREVNTPQSNLASFRAQRSMRTPRGKFPIEGFYAADEDDYDSAYQ
jgi:hypothetical protein